MTRAGVFLCVVGVAVGGCQWVLPIHEQGADAGSGRGSSTPDGGATGDGMPTSDTDAMSETDGHEMDAADGNAPACKTFTTGVPACDTCLGQMCCAAFDECYSVNAECQALQTCVEGCSLFDFGCPATCVSMHPAGENDLAAVAACSKPCDSTCMGAVDASIDVGPAASDGDPCDPSTQTKCPGGVLDCVPATDPFAGTCRLVCEVGDNCVAAGLNFDVCCSLPSPMINICIPNQDVAPGMMCD